MPCTSPLTVMGKSGNSSSVACGQCLHCRILKKSSLTLRNLLEWNTSISGQFLTLTYETDPETLYYPDIQRFLKRFRKNEKTRGNPLPIRFFCCGEYGTKSNRAHWHLLIYNARSLPQGLQRLEQWPFGHAFIGAVTPQSIGYTVRYTTKFSMGDQREIGRWSSKPGLGETGLEQVATGLAKKNTRLDGLSCMTFSGKKYAMDKWSRDKFIDCYLKAGGNYRNLGNPTPTDLEVIRMERLLNTDEENRALAQKYETNAELRNIEMRAGDVF